MSPLNPTARPFSQVTVFGGDITCGNPLAVVLAAEGLTESSMAAFARFTNLSETTFVLPPGDPAADYRVRIFTPVAELPFAGHPTLGTAAAFARYTGRRGPLIQESAAGLVEVRLDPRPAFAAPASTRRPLTDLETGEITGTLGVAVSAVTDAALIECGPLWWTLMLDSPELVEAVTPDLAAMAAAGRKVALAARSGEGLVVRAFTLGGSGIVEDPVTGSLNGGLAQWIFGEDPTPGADYTATQVTSDGRGGSVRLSHDGTQVWVAGDVATVIEGTVHLG